MHRFLALALPAAIVLGVACSGDDEEPPPVDPSTTSGSGGRGGAGAGTTTGGGDGGTAAQGGEGGAGGQGGEGGTGGACVNSLPVEMTPPALLSQTGLYDDIATKAVRATSRLYVPQYPLWSDGVDKNRWMYLPECDPIDNGDDDFWDFPVGTRAWKEFTTDGKRLETRLIMRTGPGATDFVFATYQWREDELEADLLTTGASDVRGTNHDIPADTSCPQCHGGHPFGGTPSRFLGFGAIQLSHTGAGATMQSLSDEGKLTAPRPQGYPIPGDATAQAALGMLHANCGNCHNESPDGLLFPQMNLFVSVTETTVESTALYQQSVNVVPDNYAGQGCTHRIAGGSTAGSCIYERMSLSTMPPLASDVVHTDGLAALEAWILTLPAP